MKDHQSGWLDLDLVSDLESAVQSPGILVYETSPENNEEGTSLATECPANHNNHHHAIDVGQVLPETSQTSGTGQASTTTAAENAAADNTSPASMVESMEAVKSPPGGVCKQTNESHSHSDPTATAARSKITKILSDHASSSHPEGKGKGKAEHDHDHDGAMQFDGGQKPLWIKMMESESNKKNWDNRLSHQKIQKVPSALRQIESNKKCYDPMLVAIGPYHHGRPELQQMEDLKIRFAEQYLAKCEKGVWELYQTVVKQLVDAKNCYEDSVKNIDDESFAKMMFLDACLVIQIISNHHSGLVTINDRAAIVRDIFLLENQLPYTILTALMKLRFINRGERKKMIGKFIYNFMKQILVDMPEEINKGKEDEDFMPMHLLHLVRTKIIDDNQVKDSSDSSSLSDWYPYRSFKELKSVGIHIGPSHSRRLSDITFKSRCLSGCLKIPRIAVQDYTKSMLLNLVAYEASINMNCGVSAYVDFMNMLIDHAEDVKKLRSNGVILNLLGSDQQVADLFNQITENIVFSSHGFVKVKMSIQQYYYSRPRLWLAECLHNHFRSPWSIMAFLAAVVVVFLTLAQTILSAFQI